MEKRIIEIKDLSFSYPDGTMALSGINLEVLKDERLGLIGPNGAGKSSLLLHLNGLLTGQGTIKIAGLELNRQNLLAIRKKVGLVFQDPEDQLFMPTVYEDVSFGPQNLGLKGPELKDSVESALAAVDLSDKKEHLSYHLSLGEKKRAALATILSMRPEIFVLDEPSSNLDPRSRRAIIRILKALPATTIIASHDLELILEVCNRVVLLDKGKVISQGQPKELFIDQSLMESHGLEVPISLRLR